MGVLEALRDGLIEAERYQKQRELECEAAGDVKAYLCYLRAGNALRGNIEILNRRIEGGSAEDELNFWKMQFGMARAQLRLIEGVIGTAAQLAAEPHSWQGPDSIG